jgi:hypothetical protein|nr:MAG TPA: hypothetical protein [Caudoviricetes sp.]
MIIFNLEIDLARIGAHRSADNLLSDIANVLHVDKSDLVLSSVYGSISEYRLGIETEGDIKKARFLMSELKNAKLALIKSVQLRQTKRGE